MGAHVWSGRGRENVDVLGKARLDELKKVVNAGSKVRQT